MMQEKMHGPQKKCAPANIGGIICLTDKLRSRSFGCQRKITPKNITMPNTEEIKAFAEAEGFEIRTCGHFARSLVPLVENCCLCGDAGIYFLAHETAWPPAALEMMIADRARRDEIAASAKSASAALHRARGQNDFAGRERGLNEVNQRLMEIWTTATRNAPQ